ncbi:MAG: hypothetical protein V4523_05090 [Pseudomonadota bacterium]
MPLIIGTLLAMAFALHMLWDETKRLLHTLADIRALSGMSVTVRRMAWQRWIWPARPYLSIIAIVIWFAVVFMLACQLARLVMAA